MSEQGSAPVGLSDAERVWELPIDGMEPNPYQPRRTFNEASIDELSKQMATGFAAALEKVLWKRTGLPVARLRFLFSA